MSTDTTNVGMIGLGLMGTALAERLLEAGYTVWVHNRTREKAEPLLSRGVRWADNPLTVCDRVLISLYTTDTVEEVLDRLSDGLRPGQILIDTTTGEPEQTARLGARLAARGVHYLDAPISGSSEQTRRGEAIAIVGGAGDVMGALPRPVRLLCAQNNTRRPVRQRCAHEAGHQPGARAQSRGAGGRSGVRTGPWDRGGRGAAGADEQHGLFADDG